MISNFSEIFRQNMLSSMTESNVSLPKSSSALYKELLSPSSENRTFFNRNNILDLVRRKKYDRAVKLIKSNKVNAFSLFDGVNVFGNTYDKIPFIAAALALAIDKSKNTESMRDKINEVISNLFIPSGINSANMFDAKFVSKNGYEDVLSFLLSHDGGIKDKKYEEDRDLDVLLLLNFILDGGYTFENRSGMIRFILENDMISSLKRLVESNLYTLNLDDMKRYSLSPVSNVGKYISFSAPHPFKFHSPEVEYDDKGKFAGGSIYSPLKGVGYDISKPDKEFKVHISVPFMIKDFVELAKRDYLNGGENFSNESDVNFGEGSEFLDAVNMLKYLSTEYGKYIRSREMKSMSEDDRRQYMQQMVKSANDNILRLQNGMNTILSNIGFPKVVLVMNNTLDDDDKKILFKTSPFMKEIWNSVKLTK